MRSLDIELEGCNNSHCKDHTVKEWPVLEEICDHLGSNLKEMVFRLSACSNAWLDSDLWIVRFAKEMTERGITSCTAVDYLDDFFTLDYRWAASTSESSLVDLMRKVGVRGKYLIVNIWGSQDAALRVPANVLEVLSDLAEDGQFCLYTNIKIQSLANLEHLKKCIWLALFNRAAIEDEEVEAMNGILAQVAVDPRPRNPNEILLPKVNKQYPP